MNIFFIIEVLLWLALCMFLFIVLYDHYVDKTPFLAALSKRTKQVFFSTCLGKVLFFIVIAIVLFLLYTILFDNSVF